MGLLLMLCHGWKLILLLFVKMMTNHAHETCINNMIVDSRKLVDINVCIQVDYSSGYAMCEYVRQQGRMFWRSDSFTMKMPGSSLSVSYGLLWQIEPLHMFSWTHSPRAHVTPLWTE